MDGACPCMADLVRVADVALHDVPAGGEVMVSTTVSSIMAALVMNGVMLFVIVVMFIFV